jgi:hypothetical protein
VLLQYSIIALGVVVELTVVMVEVALVLVELAVVLVVPSRLKLPVIMNPQPRQRQLRVGIGVRG